MTDITIRTVGNRSLYRDLYESIDSKTHHRTASGAAKRLEKIDRDAKAWERSMGRHWGHVEIEIDGELLDSFDALWLMPDSQDSPGDLERRIARAVATAKASTEPA